MFRCGKCGGLNRIPPAGGNRKRPICGRCKQPLDTSGTPQEVDDGGFDRTIKHAPVPVLVDFWAPWCGPCRSVAPVVAALAREHAGELIVLKVNSDENPGVASRYQISGIPSLLLFEHGREIDRQVGAVPKAALEGWLRPHL